MHADVLFTTYKLLWIQNEVSRHRVLIGNNIQWVSHQSAIQAGIQAEVSSGRSCIIAMTTGNTRSDPHPRLTRHSLVPELAMLVTLKMFTALEASIIVIKQVALPLDLTIL